VASASSFIATNSTLHSGTVRLDLQYHLLYLCVDVPKRAKKSRVERGLYRSEGVYYACVTPPGERQARWRTLGEVGLMQARRLRDEFAVEVRRERTPPAGRSPKVAEVTADWLAEQHHRVDVDDLSQRTYDGYESALRLHALPTLGGRRIASITADQLVAWHRQQLAAGHARDSI
jgi:hypothetical protein